MILGKVGPICHPSIIFSIHIYRFPPSKNKGTIKNMDYSMEMDCPSIFLSRLLWREASDKHRSRSHRLKGSKVLLILLGYLHCLLHKHCWNLQRRFIPRLGYVVKTHGDGKSPKDSGLFLLHACNVRGVSSWDLTDRCKPTIWLGPRDNVQDSVAHLNKG